MKECFTAHLQGRATLQWLSHTGVVQAASVCLSEVSLAGWKVSPFTSMKSMRLCDNLKISRRIVR